MESTTYVGIHAERRKDMVLTGDRLQQRPT